MLRCGQTFSIVPECRPGAYASNPVAQLNAQFGGMSLGPARGPVNTAGAPLPMHALQQASPAAQILTNAARGMPTPTSATVKVRAPVGVRVRGPRKYNSRFSGSSCDLLVQHARAPPIPSLQQRVYAMSSFSADQGQLCPASDLG